MNKKCFFSAASLLAVVTLLAPSVRPVRAADAAGDTMRAVAAKYKGAAVTLAVVIRTSGTGFGNADNTEVEVAGVIIDPSGLVVTTNTAIDPASTFAGMDSELAGKMTTKVVSARILVPDGDDIPAKVVLRDSDRNLAFLRPIAAPKTPLPFVDLKVAGKAQIGDPVFLLSRTGAVGNRSPQTTMLRIVSILERPRTLYLLDTLGLQGIGNLAFDEQALPLGLVTVRVGPGGKRRTFSASENVLPIVVPIADVAEEAAQAPQASAVKDTDVTPPTSPKKPTPAAPGKKPVK